MSNEGVMIKCDDGTAIHRDKINSAFIDGAKGLVVVGKSDIGEVILHRADSRVEAESYIDQLCLCIRLDDVKRRVFKEARHRIYASFLQKAREEKEGYNRKADLSVISSEFYTDYSEVLCSEVINNLIDNHYLSDYGMGMKGVSAHPPLRSVNRMVYRMASRWRSNQAPPRDTVLDVILKPNDDWPSYPTQWGEMFITALLDQGFAVLRHESQDICLKLLLKKDFTESDSPNFEVDNETVYEESTHLRNFIDQIKIQ